MKEMMRFYNGSFNLISVAGLGTLGALLKNVTQQKRKTIGAIENNPRCKIFL